MRAARWLVASVAALALSFALHAPATSLAVPERFQYVIAAVGWQPADVPMLAAVVECESSWNTFAVGLAGELGLAQFTPATWAYINTPREKGGLGSDALPSWEAWTNPATQFYQARVLFEEYSWEPWTCAWPYL